MMRELGMILAAFFFFFSTSPSFPADKEFQFRKQPQLEHIKPRKPVKIKLKRSGKNDYSWELSGDNADEIVRVDRRLRKLLKVE